MAFACQLLASGREIIVYNRRLSDLSRYVRLALIFFAV